MENEIDAQRAKEEEIRHQSPEFILLEDEFAVKVHVQRRDELRRDEEDRMKTTRRHVSAAIVFSFARISSPYESIVKDCIQRNETKNNPNASNARTSKAHPTVTANVSVRYMRVTVGIDAYHCSSVFAIAGRPNRINE